MQYLLTSEEYNKMYDQTELIQRLCTEVANNKATLFWQHTVPKIWGCILTNSASYCDCCPVRSVCPNEHKQYSK